MYFSLDEARNELKKRWQNKDLKAAIEADLGGNIFPEFKEEQRALIWKSIASPDNTFTFFNQCSRYIGLRPLIFEFLDDIYLSINDEKRGLGQLRVTSRDNKKGTVNIIDLHRWNKQKFTEITLKDDTTLTEFHHNLLLQSGYEIEYRDNSNWAKSKGKASAWYYYFLLHFIAHGALFECFTSDNEDTFLNDVVKPSIEKIKNIYHLDPIIINPFPDPNTQSEAEDFYWWSYPPHVNKYLFDYAQSNQLTFVTKDIM